MPGERHWARGVVSPPRCSQATTPCTHPSTGRHQPLLGCPHCMRWAPIPYELLQNIFPQGKMGPKAQTCSLTGLLGQGGLKELGQRGVERGSVPDLAMLPHDCPHACSWPHMEQVAGPQAVDKWELPSPRAQHWLYDGDALLHVGSCPLGELSGLSRGISPSQSSPRLSGQSAPGLHAAKGQPFPKGACSLGEGRESL